MSDMLFKVDGRTEIEEKLDNIIYNNIRKYIYICIYIYIYMYRLLVEL